MHTAPYGENTTSRLEGLDIARFIAFVGMVIVNFKTAMGVGGTENASWLLDFAEAFEGRAAAIFVVLAGLGLGLAAARNPSSNSVPVTLKRAMFLLILGLINALIFEADILHYYAFYFLFGMIFLKAEPRALLLAIAALIIGFVIALMFFDYDKGWDWETLTYIDFWHPVGMIRNLLFNGWHPVIPWLAFFLFGILLSRLRLQTKQTQITLAIGGIVAVATVEALSYYVTGLIGPHDPEEIAILFATKPIPPMPFYMVAGLGVASVTVGLCLLGENLFKRIKITALVGPAGRQTLTLYIAHIIIGMGTLEALGYLAVPQTIEPALTAALLFSFAAMVYAFLWVRFFKRGPIEWLMRKMAG